MFERLSEIFEAKRSKNRFKVTEIAAIINDPPMGAMEAKMFVEVDTLPITAVKIEMPALIKPTIAMIFAQVAEVRRSSREWGSMVKEKKSFEEVCVCMQ